MSTILSECQQFCPNVNKFVRMSTSLSECQQVLPKCQQVCSKLTIRY